MIRSLCFKKIYLSKELCYWIFFFCTRFVYLFWNVVSPHGSGWSQIYNPPVSQVTGTCHHTQLVLDLHWLSASTCKSFAHYAECHQPVPFLRGTHNPSIYTQAMTFGPGDRENWVEGQYMQHSAEDSRYRLLRVLILWVIGGALYFQATCMTTRERWGPRGGSLTKHPGILLEADSMTSLCLAY